MASFKVKSLNISKEKGTVKTQVDSIILDEKGLVGDAHAGKWHRQVSLLGTESYSKVAENSGLNLDHGAFAENITTEGFILHEANVFDRFASGEILMEVTQIGKKCHRGCEIQQQIGDCIMPKEGIFCRVLRGGEVEPGVEFEYIPKVIRIHIITLSDRAFSGEYEDRSGPAIETMMREFFDNNRRQSSFTRTVLPDREESIREVFQASVSEKYDIVITTGGTGIGPRDITPDVIAPMLDKEIPGIMEHIRVKYGSAKLNALISRSIAGVAGNSLVYVLPGSVKAVNEYMSEIIPTLEHSLRMLHSIDSH
jgi:molybdenum cofactor synthesis domain-containing protein